MRTVYMFFVKPCQLSACVSKSDIFRDAFNREPGIRADILRALCDGPKNVSGVAKALGVEKGGRVSSSLDQLEEAGFVSSEPRSSTTDTCIRPSKRMARSTFLWTSGTFLSEEVARLAGAPRAALAGMR